MSRPAVAEREPSGRRTRRPGRASGRVAVLPGLLPGLLPGVLSCASAAAVALVVGRLVPVASPLLVALLLGVVVAAVRPLPAATEPGLAFSGRSLLRAGIVLLGLQVSLRDVAGLGIGTVALVVTVVAGGIAGSMWVGRLLGLTWTQRLLVACGFSICGAAAVAAVDGSLDADEEEVATSVGLVVVCGTLMIGLVPLASGLLGLDERSAGLWAGASIHEVAQVVAAGGVIGSGALAVAVVVKLARVLLLAPVLVWVGWQRRRQLAAEGAAGARPPLVPAFVAGFVTLVLVHTWVPLPGPVLDVAGTLETALLAAAMFALGCGVRVGRLRRAGLRPAVLATVATGWVAAIGLAGTLVLAAS
jgi:uncharacterized integral membrane protein (TIGR00698 family)